MNAIKTAVAATLASGTSLALAAPPVLTTLTEAVDFSTVTAAILGVGAAAVGMYLAWRGAKFVLSAVKSL